MKKLHITSIALLIVLLAACKEEPKVISVDPLSFNLSYEAQSGIFAVESNTEWAVNPTQIWLTVTKTGSITGGYSVELNKTNEMRTAYAEVSGPDAQTQNITFIQEEFPLFKGWMRTGEGFREYFDFNDILTGNYKWYNTVTLQYEEDRDFIFDFDNEKITITFLDNYDEFIYFYSFSPDRLTLTLGNSYGDEYIYN